jgi:uncharacterized protein YggE
MRIVMVVVAALSFTASCADGGGSGEQLASVRRDAAPLAPSGAQPDTETAATTGVSVVGEGSASGTPDILRATVGVEVIRPTVDEALSVANQRATAVIDAVIDHGVDEQDIQTTQLSMRPRFEEPQPHGGSPSVEGYVASNLVEIEISDIDSAGEVLQAVADAGGDATRIRDVSFALEDDEHLLEAARRAAFQDARDKAEQYAALAGRDLGQLMAIVERTTPPSPFPEFRGRAALDEAGAAPPVQPGQQEVVVRVEARWSLD